MTMEIEFDAIEILDSLAERSMDLSKTRRIQNSDLELGIVCVFNFPLENNEVLPVILVFYSLPHYFKENIRESPYFVQLDIDEDDPWMRGNSIFSAEQRILLSRGLL